MRQVDSRLRTAESSLDEAMALAARPGLLGALSAEQLQSLLDTIDRTLSNLATLKRRLAAKPFSEPSLAMLYESTLLASGRMTVPKAVRDALRIRPGDKLLWTVTPSGTVVVTLKRVRRGAPPGTAN